MEIDGSNDEQTEKTQENDTTKPKIVIEEVEEKEEKPVEEPVEEKPVEEPVEEPVENK